MENSKILYAQKRDFDKGGTVTQFNRIRVNELTEKKSLNDYRYARKYESFEPEPTPTPTPTPHSEYYITGKFTGTSGQELTIINSQDFVVTVDDVEIPGTTYTSDGLEHTFKAYVKDETTFNTLDDLFEDCKELTSIDFTNFDFLFIATSAVNTFSGCIKLVTVNINNILLSSVTDASYMFGNCTALTTINAALVDLQGLETANQFIGGNFHNVNFNMTDLYINEWVTENLLTSYSTTNPSINITYTYDPSDSQLALLEAWQTNLPDNVHVQKAQ